jgi:2-dehydropantoate 2-reductase
VKIAVYGTGGVGGYLGGRLALAGADVHLIARGSHLEAIRKNGLKVTSTKGDFEVDLPATDDLPEIGACDFVIFGVKSYDTDEAAPGLHPLIGDNTAVVTFQNGVDNEDKIARVVGEQHVLGGVAYIFSRISEPGVIAHTGGPARFIFGEMDGTPSDRAHQLLDMCVKADVDAKLSEDIVQLLWDKFAFICAQAGMTAAVRLPIGDIRDVEESREAFRSMVGEVVAVAAAEGVDLPADTLERHMSFADKLEPSGYSSLYDDLVTGRRMELEALHGTVLRRAERHNVQVPVSAAIYSILRPWAVRNQ